MAALFGPINRQTMLDSLPEAARVERLAYDAAAVEVAQAWLFPACAAGGAVIFPYGWADVDLDDPSRRIVATPPLGVVRVQDGSATVERLRHPPPVPDGEFGPPDVAPLPPLDAPPYAIEALRAELAAAAVDAALAVAAGRELAPADATRTGALFSAVVPEWALDTYRGIAPEFLAAIGVTAAGGRLPPVDRERVPPLLRVPGVVDDALYLRGDQLAAALSVVNARPTAASPLSGRDAPAGQGGSAALAATGLTDDDITRRSSLFAAAADPRWLIEVHGLTPHGSLQSTTCVGPGDDPMWCGVTLVDDDVMLGGPVHRADIPAMVRASLHMPGASELQGRRMSLPAGAMHLLAIAADRYQTHGDSGFAASTSDLAAASTAPPPGGFTDAVQSLHRIPTPAVGAGAPTGINITEDGLHTSAQVRNQVRELGSPQGFAVVRLRDLTDPAEPSAGVLFIRSSTSLWGITVDAGGAGPSGEPTLELISVRPDDIDVLVGALLGD